jgi:hypothetical protein
MSNIGKGMIHEVPHEVFHRLQCYYALQIEVKTGMRHSRGSVLKLVQKVYGVKSRTKAGAMEELRSQLEDLGHTPVVRKES